MTYILLFPNIDHSTLKSFADFENKAVSDLIMTRDYRPSPI